MKDRTIELDVKEVRTQSRADRITSFLLKNKGKFYTRSNLIMRALDREVNGQNYNLIELLHTQKKISSKECECHGNILFGIK